MRRRTKHRGAIFLVIIIPAVLLIAAAYGVSGGFKGTLGRHPGGASGQAGPNAPAVRSDLNIGVYEAAVTPPLKSVQKFGKDVGHKPDLLLVYSEWNTAFRAGVAWSAYHEHMTVIDQMEPKNISIQAIADGSYDRYLRAYASSVKKFGHPVIIGFGHEMNGSWYSWGRSHVSASTFRAAWRHVVTVFRQQHAGNVTWLWTVAHAATGLQQYWPGGKYVKMVGIDGYFERRGDTFASIFGVAIRAVRKFTTDRVLIAETAAGPLTGHQAKDVRRLFAGAEKDHLTGLVWFNEAQHNGLHHQDWQLRGRALAAFRKAARNSSRLEVNRRQG